MLRRILSAIGAFFGTIWGWLSRRAAAIGGWAKRRPIWATILALFLIGLYSAAVLGAGLAGGVLAEREDLPSRIQRRFGDFMLAARVRAGDDAQTARWQQAILNQHTLEWATIRIGDRNGGGGGLVEVGGHIVFASPLGRINYLSAQNRLAPIDLRVPMNLEGLRASPLMEDPLFSIGEFRTHDLFARETAPGRWELYASFSRYVRENCFNFVVARARLDVTIDSVRAASPTWEDMFIARPGCIRYKDRSWRFVGMQAAGRMQMLDDRTMLISIGDHQFDGFNDAHNAPMDPAWDLGKIIAFDLTTRRARTYALGFRNPQGLVIMRDGRIFETEHGPQGGDEINFVREGANYGWPIVTYGMNYGFPRRNWPFDPTPGAHDGYERPAMAFVPSIGISNLVQPNAEEFPNWANNDLILGSLRANTLFHVRTDGERVVYAEPLRFGYERLRDIISMRDGRIVMLTDLGNLIFIRNAERHAAEPREFTVSGLSGLSSPLPEESPPGDVLPVPRGRQIYGAVCASCHSLDGDVGIGPPLNGVVGRPVGAVAGFGYSPALANYDGVWTEELLQSFITEPQRHFRGTTMPPPTISWQEAPNIVAFLRTTRRGDTPIHERARDSRRRR